MINKKDCLWKINITLPVSICPVRPKAESLQSPSFKYVSGLLQSSRCFTLNCVFSLHMHFWCLCRLKYLDVAPPSGHEYPVTVRRRAEPRSADDSIYGNTLAIGIFSCLQTSDLQSWYWQMTCRLLAEEFDRTAQWLQITPNTMDKEKGKGDFFMTNICFLGRGFSF